MGATLGDVKNDAHASSERKRQLSLLASRMDSRVTVTTVTLISVYAKVTGYYQERHLSHSMSAAVQLQGVTGI